MKIHLAILQPLSIFITVLFLSDPITFSDNEQGITRQFVMDAEIEKHPSVIFSDDFKGGDLSLWDEDQTGGDTNRLAITRTPEEAYTGKHAIRVTATRHENSGGGLIKWLDKGYDELYFRFYVKFAKDAGYTHHFVHLCGSTERWGAFGKAGIRPDGDDFFTTGIEPWFDWGNNPPPGKWFFYTYWPDMKASPDGKYWGNGFYPDSGPIPQNEWLCIEIRVKMNTPGQADGEQTVWENGVRTGHFTEIRWRTTDDLKANIIWLMSYVTERAFRHSEQHASSHNRAVNLEQHTVWFDNVVVSTEYIGPVHNP